MDAEQIVHDVADKVRAIVNEAEERAAAIVREAEEDAKGIRERAEAEGRERLEEVRRAFEDLQGKLGTKSEVEPGPVVVPEPEPPPVPEPEPAPVPEPTPPEPAPDPEPAIVPEPSPPPDEGTPPAAGNGERSSDAAGARLVAMNMALDGASREEIEAKLAEDYDVADPGEIADEVLSLSGK